MPREEVLLDYDVDVRERFLVLCFGVRLSRLICVSHSDSNCASFNLSKSAIISCRRFSGRDGAPSLPLSEFSGFARPAELLDFFDWRRVNLSICFQISLCSKKGEDTSEAPFTPSATANGVKSSRFLFAETLAVLTLTTETNGNLLSRSAVAHLHRIQTRRGSRHFRC